jgi:hypothetical protein
MPAASCLGLRRSNLALAPLAVGGGYESGSSCGVSPSTPTHPDLSESGNVFKIGGFAIGRDGVTETASAPVAGSAATATAASTVASASAASAASAPPTGDFGISFDDLQMLQIIGRGASGFVRQAEHLPSGTIMAVKEI